MKNFVVLVTIVVTTLLGTPAHSQFLGFATQNEIVALQNQINAIVANGAVPQGFIYTQLAFQSPPTVLFPQYAWSDVTAQYAGIFFRAFGGASDSFGSTQAYSAPQITNFTTHNTAFFPDNSFQNTVTVVNGQSANLFVSTGGYQVALGTVLRTDGLYLNAAGYQMENRPVNQAVIIWKRN